MSTKTHPILDYPGDGPAMIEPSRLYAKRERIPRRCVLCFFADVLKNRQDTGELQPIAMLPGEGEPIRIFQQVDQDDSDDEGVSVAFPGIGAPFAASTLEEMIALGGEAFLCVGGAGVLDGAIPVGRIMIPTAALRDEGTSYHYQRRGRWSRPEPKVIDAIREVCDERGLETSSIRTWTTDGVYRETPEKIALRRGEGCSAVEMEAAAFFAVADFRGVALGQVLYAGDDVSGDRWEHRDWITQVKTRETLFEIALEAVRRVPLNSR